MDVEKNDEHYSFWGTEPPQEKVLIGDEPPAPDEVERIIRDTVEWAAGAMPDHDLSHIDIPEYSEKAARRMGWKD